MKIKLDFTDKKILNLKGEPFEGLDQPLNELIADYILTGNDNPTKRYIMAKEVFSGPAEVDEADFKMIRSTIEALTVQITGTSQFFLTLSKAQILNLLDKAKEQAEGGTK